MPAGDRPFTAAEWSSCLKVLAAVAADPDSAPEAEAIERLAARINRRARRGRRQAAAADRAEADRDLVAATGRGRAAPRLDEPGPGPGPAGPASGGGMLRARGRACYICKGRYRDVDPHYHQLCPGCAGLNHAKRAQAADLAGRRALVTGGRVKIGHAAALKLLRNGAEVVVTSRFPTDAALRFAAAPDFAAWGDRLLVEPLDLRSIPAVLACADRLAADLPALDILVNNAAQTVRPAAGALDAVEALDRLPPAALPANVRRVLGVRGLPGSPGDGPPLPDLARPGEVEDRREANSWTARLADVGAVELVEVLLINAAAPFLLVGRLRPLLMRSRFADRYVVNVAGLDGQFGRAFKADRHPHVNMSKAALNMITRTSAADYARDGIFLNSVDAGWVSHEGAYSARLGLRARGFVPPLDAEDAAARIFDPIARGIAGRPAFGQFLKDYRPTAW